MDWHKLQHKLFALDPTDPREDLAKLKAAAQGGNSGAPVAKTVDYLNESARVAEGSLKLDKEYSVADFAALAGVKVNEDPLDGIRAGIKNYQSGALAPNSAEKAVSDFFTSTGDQDSTKTQKPKKQEPASLSAKLHPRLITKLEPYKTALEKIFTSERALKKEFIELMKRADPTIESVDEAEVMKFKAPNTVKQRDPNWRDMEALRKSGAAGVHKDKKKDMKSGKLKHKNQHYESIKEMLYAKLNEKK